MSITLIIVIITALISFQAFNNQALFDKFKHAPYVESRHNEYYRWLTSGFLHKDIMHLAINMFVFWQFGGSVERTYQSQFGESGGSILFVLMYLTAIVCGDLISFAKHRDDPHYTAVGASGGVSGVLFTYILYHPWAEMSLYGIIPFRAIVGGILYLAYEEWASRKADDNIGHDAHIFGAIAGMAVTVVLDHQVYKDFIYQLLHESPYWAF
jgi:membrane associated rhomboid family serine protease